MRKTRTADQASHPAERHRDVADSRHSVSMTALIGIGGRQHIKSFAAAGPGAGQAMVDQQPAQALLGKIGIGGIDMAEGHALAVEREIDARGVPSK